MYEFLIKYPIIAFIFVILAIAVAIYLFVKEMQRMGLEEIRSYVYQKFIVAEHSFLYGENEQKFEYVVQMARSAIPNPFKILITENLLRTTIQLWFDICKDLLDDGKINASQVKE